MPSMNEKLQGSRMRLVVSLVVSWSALRSPRKPESTGVVSGGGDSNVRAWRWARACIGTAIMYSRPWPYRANPTPTGSSYRHHHGCVPRARAIYGPYRVCLGHEPSMAPSCLPCKTPLILNLNLTLQGPRTAPPRPCGTLGSSLSACQMQPGCTDTV